GSPPGSAGLNTTTGTPPLIVQAAVLHTTGGLITGGPFTYQVAPPSRRRAAGGVPGADASELFRLGDLTGGVGSPGPQARHRRRRRVRSGARHRGGLGRSPAPDTAAGLGRSPAPDTEAGSGG